MEHPDAKENRLDGDDISRRREEGHSGKGITALNIQDRRATLGH